MIVFGDHASFVIFFRPFTGSLFYAIVVKAVCEAGLASLRHFNLRL
jgi:hypothetical protein